MKLLLRKLIVVPFAAYIVTMFTVAIIGSVDKSFIRETLDNNAMPVWLAWMGIMFTIVTLHWIYKKWRNK